MMINDLVLMLKEIDNTRKLMCNDNLVRLGGRNFRHTRNSIVMHYETLPYPYPSPTQTNEASLGYSPRVLSSELPFSESLQEGYAAGTLIGVRKRGV